MANYSQKSRVVRYSLVVSVLAISKLIVSTIVCLIKIYRYLISPWIGNQCRFYPSCSSYSQQSFIRFGFFKGLYLTLRRLLKCHPWHPGGEDAVPTVDTIGSRNHRQHSTNKTHQG